MKEHQGSVYSKEVFEIYKKEAQKMTDLGRKVRVIAVEKDDNTVLMSIEADEKERSDLVWRVIMVQGGYK